MKWEDLPIDIQSDLLAYQNQFKGIYNPKIISEFLRFACGIDWDYTEEGVEFWYDVLFNNNIDLFYEKYPNRKFKIIENRDTQCKEKPEMVSHPTHYGGDTTYETIKVIEAWDLNFRLGNCVKYISRSGKKGDALEDLKKALWYLKREIDVLEGRSGE